MSTDLKDQVQAYTQYFVDSIDPVELDEIFGTLGTSQRVDTAPAPRVPVRLSGLAIAVAAAAVIFIIVGIAVVIRLYAPSSPPVVSIPPSSTTAPTTTVTTLGAAEPLVTIDPDQVNYPLVGDWTHGVAAADGTLWVTNGAGIIRWDLDQRTGELFTSDDVPFSGFDGIAVAPDGTVWTYSVNHDVALFDGSRWVEPVGYDQLDIVNVRCSPDEPCLNPITAMTVGPDGLLSLAVGGETLIHYDGVNWSILPVSPDETHAGSAWAFDMVVGSDGTLWVASWEELLTYDGDSWERFTTDDGLPSGGISSVAVAPNGDVWVGTTDIFDGTPGGGVARFDGDSWTVFDESDGLHDNSVAALAVGADGTVWAVHSGTTDPGPVEESTLAGISRFDGTAWSATTVTNADWVGIGGAVVDDTGTLWAVSLWGVIGFDGSEVTVLRLPNGTRPSPNGLPFTLPSRILPASEDPFQWQWESIDPMTTGKPTPVTGADCYGSGSTSQISSAVLEFDGGSIEFALGRESIPGVVVTGQDGTVTQVGDPWGEAAWLCSVAANDTHILAVGSGVSWSDDGITWHGIEAFEQYVGTNLNGSNLIWAAAGPGGYMVLGAQGLWYSDDLETWQDIHLPNGFGTTVWGWSWVGPDSVSIEDQIIITLGGERWIGTRP